MNDPNQEALARIQAELAKQDAEWEAQRQELQSFAGQTVQVDPQFFDDLAETCVETSSLPLNATRA